MIKTIFFDFDGVLTTDGKGSHTTCLNIQRSIPDIPLETILRCYHVPHEKVLLGELNHSKVWEDFCSCIGSPLDVDVLLKAFKDVPRNNEMFRLCEKLRTNHTIGIITDNGKERFEAVTNELHLDALFDVLILSADIGSTKKTPEIFEKALAAAKCKAHECVFIDNDQHNLIAAMGLGINVYWHDHDKNDVGALIDYLKGLGVEA